VQFRIGAPPDPNDFHPEADPRWVKLDEPTTEATMVNGTILATILSIPIWWVFPAAARPPGVSSDDWVVLNLEATAVGLGVVLVVHELIHALFHPGAGTRRGSFLGFWPEFCAPYAVWTGAWSRERFMACLLAPCVIITSALFLIQHTVPTWATLVIAFCHLQACGADLLGTLILLMRTPPRAQMRNKGWYTFWTDASPDG